MGLSQLQGLQVCMLSNSFKLNSFPHRLHSWLLTKAIIVVWIWGDTSLLMHPGKEWYVIILNCQLPAVYTLLWSSINGPYFLRSCFCHLNVYVTLSGDCSNKPVKQTLFVWLVDVAAMDMYEPAGPWTDSNWKGISSLDELNQEISLHVYLWNMSLEITNHISSFQT